MQIIVFLIFNKHNRAILDMQPRYLDTRLNSTSVYIRALYRKWVSGSALVSETAGRKMGSGNEICPKWPCSRPGFWHLGMRLWRGGSPFSLNNMAQCSRLTEVLSELRSRFHLEHFRGKKKEDGKRVCLDHFVVALAAYRRPVADHSYTPHPTPREERITSRGCSETEYVLGPLIIW